MTAGRKKLQIDMVNFRRDVEMGTTPIVLAEKYGIKMWRVWKLKAEISSKVGRRELGPMPGMGKSKDTHTEPEDCEDLYTIAIDVPSAKLNTLLESCSQQEIIAAVMQLEDQDKAAVFQAIMINRMRQITDDEPETLAEPICMTAERDVA
jgi:hypothetical protein